MPYFMMANESTVISVDKPVFHIGRRSRLCDFVLDHPAVSRQHLIVRVDESKTFVADNNTRNGTLINGIPLTSEHELADGDVIEICGIVLEYRVNLPVDKLARA